RGAGLNDLQYEILDASLNVMVRGPAPLATALGTAPTLANIDGSLSVADLESRLMVAGPDDPLRNRLRSSLVAWGYEQDAGWSAGTPRSTTDRRKRIYQLLNIPGDFAGFLEDALSLALLGEVILV